MAIPLSTKVESILALYFMKISTQVLMFVITFLLAVISGPVIIPALKRLKVGQTVRDDGPKTHLKKTGTPTMGGVIFLLPVILTGIFAISVYKYEIIPYLIVTAGFGAIGFIDDYIKVKLRKRMGYQQKPKWRVCLSLLQHLLSAY